ncbi:hypothetical protein MRB53_039959 [Persea americana]|nr:hypothetical protein MRB53_039959 [Persea americana]
MGPSTQTQALARPQRAVVIRSLASHSERARDATQRQRIRHRRSQHQHSQWMAHCPLSRRPAPSPKNTPPQQSDPAVTRKSPWDRLRTRKLCVPRGLSRASHPPVPESTAHLSHPERHNSVLDELRVPHPFPSPPSPDDLQPTSTHG